MAKKDKFGLDDDFDFGELDDFGDIEFNSNTKDDRNPVTKVAGSFVGGAKMQWESPGFRKRLIKESLPGGYGLAIDKAGSAASTMRSLYNETARELRPAARDMQKAIQRAVPGAGKFVPKALSKRMEAWLKEETSASAQRMAGEESEITLALGSIFTSQAKHESQKTEHEETQKNIDRVIDKKRFEANAAILSGIRDYAGRLVGYQDSVLIQYQKKDLELQMRQYFTQRKLLESFEMYAGKAQASFDAIAKNTGLPEFVKINQTEIAKEMLREKFIGSLIQKPSDYLRGIGSRAGDTILKKGKEQAQNMAEMMRMAAMGVDMMGDDGMGGGSPQIAEMIANTVGGELFAKALSKPSKWAKKKLEENEKVANLGNILTYGIEGGEGFFGNFLKGDKGGQFGDFIRDIFGGGFRRNDTLQTGMSEHLDEAAHFNIHARKSITDVIPGWLSKIHQELKVIRSGDINMSAETYDWDTGRFVDEAEIAGRVHKELFSKDKRQSLKSEIDGVMSVVDPDGNLSASLRGQLQKFLLKKLSNGESFDIREYTNADYYQGMNFDDAEALATHFQKRFGYDSSKGEFKALYESSGERLVEMGRRSRSLMDNLPDAKNLLLKYAKTGQLETLMGLGIIKREGGTYTVDNAAYLEAIRSGKIPKSIKLPGLAGGFGGGFKGGISSFSGSSTPSLSPVMPEITGDTQDKLDLVMDRVIDAIMGSSSRQGMAEANAWLQQIYAQLQTGIMTADMVSLGASPEDVRKGFMNMTIGELGSAGIKSVGNAIKGTQQFVSKSFSRGKKMLGTGFDFLKKHTGPTFGKIWQGALDLKQGMSDRINDIYVKGKNSPVLKAAAIRAGEYYDQVTGDPIKSLKDIKGAVVDKAGNVILTLEEYHSGLFDIDGREMFKRAGSFLGRLKQDVEKRVKSGFKISQDVGRFARDVLTDAKDIYVKGDVPWEPRMTVQMMRNGLYHDANTLETIYRYEDIKGSVLNNDGKMILTSDDLQKGLVDREGNPIKGLSEKVVDIAKGIKDQALENFRKIKGFGKGVWESVKGFGRKAKDAIFGDGTFNFALWMQSKEDKTVEALNKIYSLLDTRLPGGNKSFNDKDGDGIREGSYAADTAEEEASAVTGKRGRGFDKLRNLKERLKGKASNGEKNEGGGILSSIMDKIPGASLLKKLLPTVGGAMTLGSGILSGLGSIATGAVSIGMGIGGVIGSVLSSPVVLTGLALAAVAYGGYKLYQHLTTDETSMTRLRFIQYGIDERDEDQINKVVALEEKLLPDITFNQTGLAQLNTRAKAEEILEIFGIGAEDQEAQKRWAQWYQLRFKPVFITHVTATKRILGYKDLKKLDDTLTPEQRLSYVKLVSMKGAGSNVFIMVSPWANNDDIEHDASDVDDVYAETLEEVEELAKKSASGSGNKDKARAGAAALAAQQKAKDVAQRQEDAKADIAEKEKEASSQGGFFSTLGKATAAVGGIYSDTTSYWKQKGGDLWGKIKGWVWPTEGKVSSIYGPRVHPITGEKGKMHGGIDIAAPEGTPVRAAAAGIIVRREYSKTYGNVIYIKHEDGKTSRYAHMAKFEPGLNVGDVVEAGQLIGYVGNTGDSAGNHLHFEIRKTAAWDSETIDPTNLIGTPEARAALAEADKAAKMAAQGDKNVYDEKDTMEGMDTITSTVTGESMASQARNAGDGAAASELQNDKKVLTAQEKAKAAASATAVQKGYESEMSLSNMSEMANLLRSQLKVQQSMDSKMSTVADSLLKIEENTGLLIPMEQKGAQIAESPGRKKTVATVADTRKAPLKVSNKY